MGFFQGHQNARRSLRAHAARHLLRREADREGAARDDRQGDRPSSRPASRNICRDREPDRAPRAGVRDARRRGQGGQLPGDRRHHRGSQRGRRRGRRQAGARRRPDRRRAGRRAYEITRYGTLVAWAKQLGRGDCAAVLPRTSKEEKATDKKLTEIGREQGQHSGRRIAESEAATRAPFGRLRSPPCLPARNRMGLARSLDSIFRGSPTMAPRPAWKGYLKLSLVTCAVELTDATDHSEKVSFRVINRKTGNTVKRQYVDADHRQAGRGRGRGQGLRDRRRRIPADRGGRDRRGADRILAHDEPRRLRRQAPTSSRSISTRPIISRPPTRFRRRPSP